jgi:hypothetical protein
VVQFIHADDNHQFLVNQFLRNDQGLTFDVFKDIEEIKEEEQPPEEEEGEERAEKVVKQPEEKFPNHILVPEVVREPRMHFFRVPKLGSYLAIRLEYQSCLFEEAFDAGLVDFLGIAERQRQQAEEIKAWEDAQEDAREEAEAQGTEWNPEQKLWEEILPQPFKTQQVQFVVCLNTLGQDRVFTEEEKKFALRTVQQYRDIWERTEEDNLRSDINLHMAAMDFDKKYKESYEVQDN